jgi:K+-transporting ATPase KdpF subunit
VSGDNVAGLIIAAALMVFCLAALLFPERF